MHETSGIPVVNTIRLSCITLSSEVIKELFEEASAKVVEGSSLSKALSRSEGYRLDDAFVEAVAIGEEADPGYVVNITKYGSGTWVLSGYSGLYRSGYDPAPNPKDGLFQYDGWGYPPTGEYKYMGGTSMSNRRGIWRGP